MRCLIATLLLAVAPLTAQAEVVSSGPNGFSLENEAAIKASPDRVYQALGEIGRWWDSAHSYSGDAANMTIEMKPGGCFCEALPGGGIKHGEVVAAWPNRMLRLDAPLGPLQGEGVSAALTFAITPGKDGVQLSQTFNVGGLTPERPMDAALIDQVVGLQLARLKRYVETGAAQ